MTTNEELAAKVEALETRVGQLERLFEAMGEMTREQTRHAPPSAAKASSASGRTSWTTKRSISCMPLPAHQARPHR